MNGFKEIKDILKNKEVVEFYIGKPVKVTSSGNWYISPFRKEKTASFCVSDKGIHDFGDSRHYDLIGFVQRYFNTTPINALKIIQQDFNIALGNEYETDEAIKILKQKRKEEEEIKRKVNNWFLTEFNRLCNEEQINNKCIDIFSKKANFEVLKVLYDKELKLDLILDDFISADEDKKIKLYLESVEDNNYDGRRKEENIRKEANEPILQT